MRPCLPVRDVTFILGNDLAGGKVFVNPEVTDVPFLCSTPDELNQKYPEVFPLCTVTRAMAQRLKDEKLEEEWDFDLKDTFLSTSDSSKSKCSNSDNGSDIAV